MQHNDYHLFRDGGNIIYAGCYWVLTNDEDLTGGLYNNNIEVSTNAPWINISSRHLDYHWINDMIAEYSMTYGGGFKVVGSVPESYFGLFFESDNNLAWLDLDNGSLYWSKWKSTCSTTRLIFHHIAE